MKGSRIFSRGVFDDQAPGRSTVPPMPETQDNHNGLSRALKDRWHKTRYFGDQLVPTAARACSVGQVVCIGAHAPASLGPLAAISITNLYCEEFCDLCCSYGARCDGYAGVRPYQGHRLKVLLKLESSTSAVPRARAYRSTPVRPHGATERVSRGS
jgi:hypothetical protein